MDKPPERSGAVARRQPVSIAHDTPVAAVPETA
jgi:hypothetical protein